MSYKMALPFRTSNGFLPRSQARTERTFIHNPLTLFEFDMCEEKQEENCTTRSRRIEARVTDAELDRIVALAQQCGLTLSNYLRRYALGQHPKQRLSDREIEALCSLTDARAELIHIRNALKGRSRQERQRYFGNPRFMEQ